MQPFYSHGYTYRLQILKAYHQNYNRELNAPGEHKKKDRNSILIDEAELTQQGPLAKKSFRGRA